MSTFTNQVEPCPSGIKTGDPVEIRGSFIQDGETDYGPWRSAVVGAMVDWGFIVITPDNTPGLARRWDDEGKGWRRAACSECDGDGSI